MSIIQLAPLFSHALLLACMGTRLAAHWNLSFPQRLALVLVLFVTALLPLGSISVAHYFYGVLGHPSFTTLTMMMFWLYAYIFSPAGLDYRRQQIPVYTLVLLAGLLLYPLSMGLSLFDPYALGYYPRSMGILLAAVALMALWKNYYLILLAILLAVLAYSIGLMHSTNLWDYLIDPLLIIYAVPWLLVSIMHRLWDKAKSMEHIGKLEWATYTVMAGIATSGWLVSLTQPGYFRRVFIAENGPVEWITVVFLIGCGLLCFYRAVAFRRTQSRWFLINTFLLALLFVFMAAAEMSWEQHPHEVSEEGLLVYGLGLAAFILGLAFTRAYQKSPGIQHTVDTLGIPVPRWRHIITGGVLIVFTQLLIFSSSRVELLECTGAMVFFMVLLYPCNRNAFQLR